MTGMTNDTILLFPFPAVRQRDNHHVGTASSITAVHVDLHFPHKPQSASLGNKLGIEPRMGVNVPVWMTAAILFKADWS